MGDVTLALERRGVEALREWYNPESSKAFLDSRQRARKMADAILARYERRDGELECLEEMIAEDGREDKGHSVAYLYLLRTALIRNWSRLALLMVQRIPYDVGTLLDAIDLDYEQIRETLDSEEEGNAYVDVLRYLSRTLTGSDQKALAAFITLKVSVECQHCRASIVETAAALMVSQNPHDYLLVRDYTGRSGVMLRVMMEASLERDIAPGGRDNDLVLGEMYDNIGLFARDEWEALQERLLFVARSRGMSQEDVDAALARTDLERVHYLAPYREALLEDLAVVYSEETEGDFDTEADVDRLVEALKSVSSPRLEDEDDRYDVEMVRRRVIGAVRFRYAHWD